ncbi:MAG TPA: hypothetical protein VH371_01330 [Candidatus Limnocylindrales bacterium]
MDFAYDMGMWALILIIVASVVYGVAIQMIGNASFGYEWLLTSIAAGIGAFGASEFIVGFRDWEPVFDGMALVPALIGGLLVGGVVAAAARLVAGGHHGAPQAI